MKREIKKVSMLLCCIVFALSVFSGCTALIPIEAAANQAAEVNAAKFKSAGEATSYTVSLDVNPSIEMTIANGVVSQIGAYNDDGQAIVLESEVVGLDANAAVEELVKALLGAGYLDSAEVQPCLIIAVAENEETAEKTAGSLEESAKGVLEGLGVDCIVKGASVSDDVAAEAASYGLSIGRYMLLDYIAKAENISMQEAREKYSGLKMGELMRMFEGLEDLFDEPEEEEPQTGLTPEQIVALEPALQAFQIELDAAQDVFHTAFKAIKEEYKGKVEALKEQFGGNAKTTEYKAALKELKITMLGDRRAAIAARQDAFNIAKENFRQAVAVLGLPEALLESYIDALCEKKDVNEGFEELLECFCTEEEEEETKQTKEQEQETKSQKETQTSAGKENKAAKENGKKNAGNNGNGKTE